MDLDYFETFTITLIFLSIFLGGIVKGSVGIFLPTNETTKPNFVIQENELFGEMGVIENELRMASARCLVESEIISITKDEFNKKVNESDVFVKGSLKALSYRLRTVEKKMQ